jgi:hypothetical protein
LIQNDLASEVSIDAVDITPVWKANHSKLRNNHVPNIVVGLDKVVTDYSVRRV